MDRRQFLVGLGAFAGAATLWRPDRTIFDMGRATPATPHLWLGDQPYVLRQSTHGPALVLALDMAIPAYGGFVLPKFPTFDTELIGTATPSEATINFYSVQYGRHEVQQPVADGRADFILPTGEGVRLRVY